MDIDPAENLLRIAKRHLDGSDGAPERSIDHVCDLLRVLIRLHPRSRAAQEAG